MNARIRIIAALISVLAAGSAAATDYCTGVTGNTLVSAATNTDTGHYFEVYRADGIDWDTANGKFVNPLDRHCGGVLGHLATITSTAEEEWVDALRQGAIGGVSGLDRGEVWIGGFQPTGSQEPRGGWLWVNNEGPIPGVNTEPAYADWNAAEPNDLVGAENHLALGRYGLGGGWNDEGTAVSSLIGGYIVEYDVPRAAACGLPTDPACQTIEGQTLVFPAGSIPPGATIPFTAYEFTDPRVAAGTCGSVIYPPLELFTASGKPLVIPPYLCGSPKFVVVAVDSSQLNILNGTVFVENNAHNHIVLPGNLYNVCEDPIVQLPYTQGDPQFQDVVVWQSTDPTRMLENSRGVGQFAGAAGEFTSFCGSSGARVKGASYFVVGLHIDFGSGSTWNGHPDSNHERFVALTLYKLSLLQQSVADAKTAGALKNGDTTKMMSAALADAVKKLGRGDASGALGSVNQFLKFVAAAKYSLIAGQNYNGEHLMRGTNIAFTLRVKVIPYGP